ncbi:MAG: hypothetical protein ACI9R3_004342 [Verrucomicrobiales bacterium]|jgi:hypothetical protein
MIRPCSFLSSIAILIHGLVPIAVAGTVEGVRSIKITNTQADWFYIEELEILNADEEDVASIDFDTTTSANYDPGFGSSLDGPIDDVFDACCVSGLHSSDNTTRHVYTITFPEAQTITGEIRVWNRQGECCSERLDGMLWEFLSGEDGEGTLLASLQVDNLAADSLGDIDTELGAAFTVPNPLTDVDSDGLPGEWETANGLDPESSEGNDGAEGDPDEDGVNNLAEFKNGTKASVADTDEDGLSDGVESNSGTFVDNMDTGTDPLLVDTDLDMLADGVETNTGTFVSVDDTGTNPLIADSDMDGLLDGVETNTGEFIDGTDSGTDPNNADTDNDTFDDGAEIAAASDPTDAGSTPEPGGTISGVVSIIISNMLPNWFYIEEIQLLNDDGVDVASLDFGTLADATAGGFGSNVDGPIDDAIGNCCGTGWHSEAFADEPQTYTLTFPEAQSITGLGTLWNRQDGCCSDRMDGMLFDYFDADGELIVSQEVLDLAGNSAGGISTASGASFPLTSGGMTAPFSIASIAVNDDTTTARVTWNSSPTGSYAIDASDVLGDSNAWTELDDGIIGEADSPTTSFTAPLEEGVLLRYYRIRRL